MPEDPPILPALAETAPEQQILRFHANWLSLKKKLKNAHTPRQCPPSDPRKGCNADTSQQGETKHSVSFLQVPAPQVRKRFLFSLRILVGHGLGWKE